MSTCILQQLWKKNENRPVSLASFVSIDFFGKMLTKIILSQFIYTVRAIQFLVYNTFVHLHGKGVYNTSQARNIRRSTKIAVNGYVTIWRWQLIFFCRCTRFLWTFKLTLEMFIFVMIYDLYRHLLRKHRRFWKLSYESCRYIWIRGGAQSQIPANCCHCSCSWFYGC